ncbi:hypothetical protein ACAW63_17480 [Pseudomonas sp. QE6]
MTREGIVLHLVSHASYHRGFFGGMLYQATVTPSSNNLPVFLRDHWRKAR